MWTEEQTSLRNNTLLFWLIYPYWFAHLAHVGAAQAVLLAVVAEKHEVVGDKVCVGVVGLVLVPFLPYQK